MNETTIELLKKLQDKVIELEKENGLLRSILNKDKTPSIDFSIMTKEQRDMFEARQREMRS